jgi:hypothetical protein
LMPQHQLLSPHWEDKWLHITVLELTVLELTGLHGS